LTCLKYNVILLSNVWFGTEVGDLLKYATSINQIDRTAKAIFHFDNEDFPNESITSSRAQTIYNWILTLGEQRMEPEKRNSLLMEFCRSLSPNDCYTELNRIIARAGINSTEIDKEAFKPKSVNPSSHFRVFWRTLGAERSSSSSTKLLSPLI